MINVVLGVFFVALFVDCFSGLDHLQLCVVVSCNVFGKLSKISVLDVDKNKNKIHDSWSKLFCLTKFAR